MTERFVKDFLDGFDDSGYPAGFLERYEALECLAAGEQGETLFVRDRESGAYAVAKCYPLDGVRTHTHESELLRPLSHDGLPAFIGEYAGGSMLCVVREYVEGTPLDKAAAAAKITPRQAINIGVQLCDILTYLHRRTPPIIHRDIKPQNIIVKPDGGVKLIDFGISRVYDRNAETDTVVFGTRMFAPPEQYGYMQTDRRSDIYSLGAVLCYLLTGAVRPEAAAEDIKDRRLAQIVSKCMAFSPKDRYADARQMRGALAKLLPAVRRRRRALFAAAAVLAAALLAPSVGMLKNGSQALLAWATGARVRFSEPLIEQDVRLQLGKAEDEPITREELTGVTGLYVFGTVCSADKDAYYASAAKWQMGSQEHGGIRSLEDVSLMPNLREICLGAQQITDVSPVSRLAGLEVLELKGNSISDVSSLANVKTLVSLGLNGSPVRDLSPLQSCAKLELLDLCSANGYDPSFLDAFNVFRFLDISNETDSYRRLSGKRIAVLKLGYTDIDSLEPLADVTGLEQLEIDHTNIKSLAGIEAHGELTYLRLTGLLLPDLDRLALLPELTTVRADAAMAARLRPVAEEAGFSVEVE